MGIYFFFFSQCKKVCGYRARCISMFYGQWLQYCKADLPVYAVHAIDDDLASPNCTLNAIKSIIDCGTRAIPNIVMYENGGHYVWVKRAY